MKSDELIAETMDERVLELKPMLIDEAIKQFEVDDHDRLEAIGMGMGVIKNGRSSLEIWRGLLFYRNCRKSQWRELTDVFMRALLEFGVHGYEIYSCEFSYNLLKESFESKLEDRNFKLNGATHEESGDLASYALDNLHLCLNGNTYYGKKQAIGDKTKNQLTAEPHILNEVAENRWPYEMYSKRQIVSNYSGR